MKKNMAAENLQTSKIENGFLKQRPVFEKVGTFLERPIEISEEFLRESGRLDENIVVVNKKIEVKSEEKTSFRS